MHTIGAWTDRLIVWLEHHSTWHQLRALGNSNLVRASVLMPAFGYVLLLNENVHQYLTIRYDGWLLEYLPSIWRIWLLFYGSFFLAIGTILYSMFCPPEVKRYGSAFEMADATREHQLKLGHFQDVRETVKTLYAQMSERERSIFPFKQPKYDTEAFGGADSLTRISTYLIHNWTLENIRRPILRIVILLLFYAGLASLAVPAAFTFVQVTGLAVKRLFAHS